MLTVRVYDNKWKVFGHFRKYSLAFWWLEIGDFGWQFWLDFVLCPAVIMSSAGTTSRCLVMWCNETVLCDSIFLEGFHAHDSKGWFTIWRWALRRIASILGQVGRLCPKSTSLGQKQERYIGYAGIEFGSIPASRCVSTAFQRGMMRRDAAPSVILWTSPKSCMQQFLHDVNGWLHLRIELTYLVVILVNFCNAIETCCELCSAKHSLASQPL